MYGVDFNAIKPVDMVSRIAPRPVFFIHGKADELVPVQHASYTLQQAYQNPQNKLWVVPGVGHVGTYAAHPKEYRDEIVAFFDSVLR